MRVHGRVEKQRWRDGGGSRDRGELEDRLTSSTSPTDQLDRLRWYLNFTHLSLDSTARDATRCHAAAIRVRRTRWEILMVSRVNNAYLRLWVLTSSVLDFNGGAGQHVAKGCTRTEKHKAPKYASLFLHSTLISDTFLDALAHFMLPVIHGLLLRPLHRPPIAKTKVMARRSSHPSQTSPSCSRSASTSAVRLPGATPHTSRARATRSSSTAPPSPLRRKRKHSPTPGRARRSRMCFLAKRAACGARKARACAGTSSSSRRRRNVGMHCCTPSIAMRRRRYQ